MGISQWRFDRWEEEYNAAQNPQTDVCKRCAGTRIDPQALARFDMELPCPDCEDKPREERR